MRHYGYGYVPEAAFVAFAYDLSEGAWNNISIVPYDTQDRTLTPNIAAAAHPVVWKLRLTWAIASLKAAVSTGALEALDGAWDTAERRIYHHLFAASDDKDAEVRAAANRLIPLLLLGGGTGQTTLPYDKEVDFGREQIELTKQGQAAADVQKLNLGPFLHDIAKATEDLAKGIGRSEGKKRTPRSALLREALAECTTAFNDVHGAITWWIDHTLAGPEREKLSALRAPLEALLERNPAVAADDDSAPEGDAEANASSVATAAASGAPASGSAAGNKGP